AKPSACMWSSVRAPTSRNALSLPDALPISQHAQVGLALPTTRDQQLPGRGRRLHERDTLLLHQLYEPAPVERIVLARDHERGRRSEEHTSELQSRENLVCRLLLEKKKSYRH